jgi:hypothetical protein
MTLYLNSEQTLYLLVFIHWLVGGTGALLAWYKGRSLRLWLFLGITCGIAVLLVALVMKPKQSG